MSKSSDRKKARRQKRLAQKVVWDRMNEAVDEHIEDLSDELADGVMELDDLLSLRGWTFDAELSSGSVVTWYYAPSGCEPADEDAEPVTRAWITIAAEGDLESFPYVVNIVLAGSTDARALSLEAFVDQLDAAEAHRATKSTFR
ncbi:MAG TPA: hypothetical protein VFB19_14890 [Mycobacterium sp.]|nr:hypothetical protein [Mycobacterium sp.]